MNFILFYHKYPYDAAVLNHMQQTFLCLGKRKYIQVGKESKNYTIKQPPALSGSKKIVILNGLAK